MDDALSIVGAAVKDCSVALTWAQEGLAQSRKNKLLKYQIQAWESEFTRRIIRLEKKATRGYLP